MDGKGEILLSSFNFLAHRWDSLWGTWVGIPGKWEMLWSPTVPKDPKGFEGTSERDRW